MKKFVTIEVLPGSFVLPPKEGSLGFDMFQFVYKNCACPGIDPTPMSTHLTWAGAEKAMKAHKELICKDLPEEVTKDHSWQIVPFEAFE